MEHDGEGKAVVAFAAHGLQHGGAEAGLGGDELGKAADTLDVGIGTVGIDDFAVADDVVGDDDGAGARELRATNRGSRDSRTCRRR